MVPGDLLAVGGHQAQYRIDLAHERVAIDPRIEPLAGAHLKSIGVHVAVLVQAPVDGYGEFLRGLRLVEVIVGFGIGHLSAGRNHEDLWLARTVFVVKPDQPWSGSRISTDSDEELSFV